MSLRIWIMDSIQSPCFLFSLLCFLFLSSKTHLTINAADTISLGQSLTVYDTIISKGGVFELGFFTPGNSQNYYIGIWYKKVPVQTVVWVANRNNPILDPFSSVLTLLITGNLVILTQPKDSIRITDLPPNTSNTTEAVLGDDGNFVLRDGSNPSVVFWQSFDHPTNTLLPGAKIGLNKRTNQSQLLTSWGNEEDPASGIFSLELDPSGTGQYLIKKNGSQQVWTSGEWNGYTFSLLPQMRLNNIYNFSYITNDNESYFTFSVYDTSIVSRLVIDFSGQIKQFAWSEKNQVWNMFWSRPKAICDVYGICGPFGTCNQDTLQCDCLSGFMKRSPKDWKLKDTTGGCVRNTSLQCGNKGVFSRMANMKMPEDPKPLAVGNAEECASDCSSMCSCNAYAYTSSGCSYWTGDLISLQQLSAGGEDLFIKISTTDDRLSKSKKTLIWKIIIPIITLVTTTLTVLLYIYLRRRTTANQRGRLKGFQGVLTDLLKTKDNYKDYPNTNMFQDGKSGGGTQELLLFDLASLATATNVFCLKNKLGEGGFGPVYKGKLQNGKEIAVKRLSKSSGQGIEELKNEVKLISKLQHRNLVKLLGCYIEGEENMLIYEYMPNKSLDTFLFDSRRKAQLDWTKRFNIIGGIARGLLYLHRDSRLRVIHRDLKVSNILLDEDMNPKISDFGMARIFGGNQTIANTSRVVGTFGYMSPEYIMGGTFSEKSDVFSYGVLLLEVVSSKRNNSFYNPQQPLNLLLHTWKLWNEGNWREIVDGDLGDCYPPLEVMRCIHIGLLCVQKRPEDRPTMSTVDFMLSSETNLPPPKEPPFTSETSSDILQVCCSNNNVTITVAEGR